MTDAIARLALLALATLAVGGCGGGKENEHVFAAADAMAIAGVTPEAPGWTWPESPKKPVWDASEGSNSADPLVVELNRRLAHLVSLGDASMALQDDDKLAQLDVGVYASSSDAHQAMAPFNAFSREWGKRTGRIIKDEATDAFGDEAWILWVAGHTGAQVTYHWRRDNLLLEAHVHCFGSCPGNVDTATRRWIDAIDAKTRARS